MGGGNASASENQEQAAAWPRRTRRIFVPFRPAGRPTMAAQIPRSGVCHQIWSRGRTPAFLWAVAVPAPAKIRSRLRQTNEAKNIWPGGICGMPPGQHCPEAVPARRGGAARTQRQANSSAKGAADTQKGLCVCRGLPSVIFRSANTGSLKISFYTGELSTVCALNLAP